MIGNCEISVARVCTRKGLYAHGVPSSSRAFSVISVAAARAAVANGHVRQDKLGLCGGLALNYGFGLLAFLFACDHAINTASLDIISSSTCLGRSCIAQNPRHA
jgi:hypothetical protein